MEVWRKQGPLYAVSIFALAFHSVFCVDPSGRGDTPQGPIFIAEPPAQATFANTRGLRLSCSAFGSPAPELDWIHTNDTPVDNVPGILEILPNNTLYFHPFADNHHQPEVHTAKYRCLATNDVGSVVSREVQVKAVLMSRYKTYNVRVNDAFVTPGSTAVFRCSINPFYMRDYIRVLNWTLNGKPITAGGRFSIFSSGELHIRAVVPEDRLNSFRCVTQNVLSSEEKTSSPAVLHVAENPGMTAPIIDVELTTVRVRQGEPASLPCVAGGVPLPSYTWSKDGAELVPGQDRVTLRGGDLVVSPASVRDSGLYVCTARNRRGHRSANVNLTVTAPLSVTVEPSRQTVDVGGTAVFNCSVYGHPVTSVTWRRNGVPLDTDDERITHVSNHTLIIEDVQRQDRGMYQCLVHNNEDSAQGSAQLDLGVARPFIFDKFEEEYIQPGTHVSLRCGVSGNPPPIVRWTRDGMPLPRDSRFMQENHVTVEGDVISQINMTHVQREDGGQYTCAASNRVGSASYSNRVNVYGIPYVRPMSNVTAVAGDVMVINCHVTGYPVEAIEWAKGPFTLPINHRQHVTRDGTLAVHDVQRGTDTGDYSCTAADNRGRGTTQHVHVTVMEPPKIDPFSFPARKQGDRVSVSCVVSSGDLPITVSWRKDGRPISGELGASVLRTGPYSSQLSIGDARPRHDGVYTCIASNHAASTNHTAAFHVDVPPGWVVEPQDSFVILRHQVRLHCQTTGTPSPRVTWRRATGDEPGNYVDIDFGQSQDSASSPHIEQLPNGTLIINDAADTDAGYYLCHSTNGINAGLSKVVRLTVHTPAQFSLGERNYTVVHGRETSLTCEATGDKPISISWTFNSQNLLWQQNNRLDVSFFNFEQGRGSKLMIKSADREDSGFYVCNAQNKFGADVSIMQLTVLERPDPPQNVDIHQSGSRTVEVTWKTAFDGNSPITAFILQYKNASDNWDGDIRNISVDPKLLKTEIDALHPAFNYQLRVLANNSIGVSNPSNVVTVTTGQEAPTGPPTQLSVLAVSSESLRVKWQPPQTTQQNGDITGYYVGYKKFNTSAPYMYVTKPLDGAAQLEVTLYQLDKFTKYSVHVQAYNVMGVGPRANDVHVLTMEDVPSEAPRDVQVTALSSSGVMVVWSPPPLSTLHGILQGYKVLYKPVRQDEDETDAMSVISTKLQAALYGLDKFTNYSVQVLAFTRMGEGMRSAPVYVQTQQDIPGRPADIKALPAGGTAILVTWRPPVYSNGQITKYTLHVTDLTSQSQVMTETIELPPSHISFKATGLKPNHKYSFQVGASTVVGDGELTHSVTATTKIRVGAQLASFSTVVHVPWKNSVVIPCEAVGDPTPAIQWRKRGDPLMFDDRVRMLSNGSLWITRVETSDAANYTCRAENSFGADEINTDLVVQAPPREPHLTIAMTTTTSIQVNWRSGSNGGSKIQGFVLYFRREHGQWKTETLSAQNRSFTATDLRCGTKYMFHVRAFNRVGDGLPSQTIEGRTNGSAPIMPPQSMLIHQLNSTFVVLDLVTWLSGGCPINFYEIHYKVWGHDVWETVDSHVTPSTSLYRVDLRPATWYIMKVTANNDAGSTDSVLKFATPTYMGSTIEPIKIVHTKEPPFHQRIYVVVPLVGCLVLVVVLLVWAILYCKRREDKLAYKEENASNLRRDLTAETSLMSDLDKRINIDLDPSDSIYGPDPNRRSNVNLLAKKGNKKDNNEESGSWPYSGCHDNSFNNGSTDEDGHINPYATFQYPPNMVPNVNPSAQDSHFEEDTISLQKEKAHKEDTMKQQLLEGRALPSPPHQLQKEPSYQNLPLTPQSHGLILNPQCYATLDQPPLTGHQKSSYLQPVRGTYHRNIKGQRPSTVSSITTDSSNQEELTKAFENSKKSPGPDFYPPYHPRTRPQTLGSSPSGSSESGIRQFTSSPPRPDEIRQAACEVPVYAGTGTHSDEPTEYESTPEPEWRLRSPSKGKVIGKRPLQPGQHSRNDSDSSSPSTASEEITYAFCDGDRPSPPRPPPPPRRTTPPRMNNAQAGPPTTFPSPSRKGQQHSYDVSPETPGSEESKPLVCAAVKPSKTSPTPPGEECRQLLDRCYQPLTGSHTVTPGKKPVLTKEGYTDDYTVV